MKTPLKTEFISQGLSIDTEKAIEAGHDARTTAIKEFAAWLSATIRAIAYPGQMQRM